MEAAQGKYTPLSQSCQSLSKIHTTLYELIETVIDVADPEENRLVNDETVNILKKAKPSFRVSAH